MPFHYAIGDVHGCYELLAKALQAIRADVIAGRTAYKVILLGDYIDRGPKSCQVVDVLRRMPRFVCLRGNHEEMMWAAMKGDNSAVERLWLSAGGRQTLQSYGSAKGDDVQVIPMADKLWASTLPLTYEDKHRIYVHAGLQPGVPAAGQHKNAQLWIREAFLRAAPGDFPDAKHIVHGHTPVWAGKPDASKPEWLPHRSNLDTGAYMTGVLTAGKFDDDLPGGPVGVLTVTHELASWSSAETY